jgi:hypothetical protein
MVNITCKYLGIHFKYEINIDDGKGANEVRIPDNAFSVQNIDIFSNEGTGNVSIDVLLNEVPNDYRKQLINLERLPYAVTIKILDGDVLLTQQSYKYDNYCDGSITEGKITLVCVPSVVNSDYEGTNFIKKIIHDMMVAGEYRIAFSAIETMRAYRPANLPSTETFNYVFVNMWNGWLCSLPDIQDIWSNVIDKLREAVHLWDTSITQGTTEQYPYAIPSAKPVTWHRSNGIQLQQDPLFLNSKANTPTTNFMPMYPNAEWIEGEDDEGNTIIVDPIPVPSDILPASKCGLRIVFFKMDKFIQRIAEQYGVDDAVFAKKYYKQKYDGTNDLGDMLGAANLWLPLIVERFSTDNGGQPAFSFDIRETRYQPENWMQWLYSLFATAGQTLSGKDYTDTSTTITLDTHIFPSNVDIGFEEPAEADEAEDIHIGQVSDYDAVCPINTLYNTNNNGKSASGWQVHNIAGFASVTSIVDNSQTYPVMDIGYYGLKADRVMPNMLRNTEREMYMDYDASLASAIIATSPNVEGAENHFHPYYFDDDIAHPDYVSKVGYGLPVAVHSWTGEADDYAVWIDKVKNSEDIGLQVNTPFTDEAHDKKWTNDIWLDDIQSSNDLPIKNYLLLEGNQGYLCNRLNDYLVWQNNRVSDEARYKYAQGLVPVANTSYTRIKKIITLECWLQDLQEQDDNITTLLSIAENTYNIVVNGETYTQLYVSKLSIENDKLVIELREASDVVND